GMTVDITLKDSGKENPYFRGKAEDEAWVRSLVCNPEMTAYYPLTRSGKAEYPGGLCDPSDHYDYVIVTTTHNGLDYWPTSAFMPYNWESLMDRHAADLGLSCTLVTMEDILAEADYVNPDPLFNDTPARIREFCRDAYQDWGTEYLLFGGDDEWLPAREMDSSAEYNVDADIYWNHLDNTFNADHDNYWGEESDAGFDLYAELYIGRIPCDEPQDVSNWLTKSFNYADEEDRAVLDNAAFYGGDTGWSCQGDDFIDYSAIKGTDNWLGPNPSVDPYPSWLGFQYGFETWNEENPLVAYDMTVKWTAEPPNPGGWMGGSSSSGINGLKAAINNDQVALISGIAHADPNMSLDVYSSSWENDYHNTKPFFIHDYGCHCGDMDGAADGVLHSMLFHSNTELAFACVYNTGYGWGNFDNTCSSSSVQQKSFWDYLFDLTNHSGSCENWQMGKAQAFSKDLMAPTVTWSDSSWRSIVQCCLLFGDPAQRIKPPEDPILYMNFPEGLPGKHLPPGPETWLTIEIKDGKEVCVPGTEYLYYRFDPADPYTQVSLAALGGNRFSGTLPATIPGDAPEFYFSADTDLGNTVCSPKNAPTDVYGFDVELSVTLFHDNFEQNLGWIVENENLTSGAWVRDRPGCGGYFGDPPSDFDGSNKCFITGNQPQEDVDGGPTTLFSPILDLSTGDAEISYYRWHYNNNNDDLFRVKVSNNNGASWERVEAVGNTTGWIYHSFKVADYVAPTSQVRVQFSARDVPDNSVTEAGLDAFKVRRSWVMPTLWADAYSIHVATASQIHFLLNAGADKANRPYLLLASATGVLPGFELPGGKTLPINWDLFTDLLLTLAGTPACQDFMGILNAQGKGMAALDTMGPLDPALIGLNTFFAYTLGSPFEFVSNPVEIIIAP
ncbi:MAG: C25 family cysteine peptidase, partial [Planctomycetota bacterium]